MMRIPINTTIKQPVVKMYNKSLHTNMSSESGAHIGEFKRCTTKEKYKTRFLHITKGYV